MVSLAVVVLWLAGCATAIPDPGPFANPSPPPFGLEVERQEVRDGYTLDVFSFQSPVAGQVPAYLYRPTFLPEDAASPALLVQHGMSGDRSSLRGLAAAYARAGVVVLSLSAPFNRTDQLDYREPRLLPAPLFNEHDGDEIIQLVRDQRRGLDLLEGLAEVDPERLGYVGHSYGGWMGALLGSVEPRLAALVLMAPTGGFVSYLRSHENNRANLAVREVLLLTPEERAQWLEGMEPFEAERWIGRPRDSPLLIQAGLLDRAVLPAEIERLFTTASPPKEILWYEGGHEMSRAAFQDQAKFLAGRIGIDLARFEAPAEFF